MSRLTTSFMASRRTPEGTYLDITYEVDVGYDSRSGDVWALPHPHRVLDSGELEVVTLQTMERDVRALTGWSRAQYLERLDDCLQNAREARYGELRDDSEQLATDAYLDERRGM